MKNQLLILGCLTLFQLSFSQNWTNKNTVELSGKSKTETRTTSDYDQISISGSFKVTLISGKEGKIDVTADEALLEKINIQCTNNKLVVEMQKGTSYNYKNNTQIEISIPVEAISQLKFTGSGRLTSNLVLSENKFKVQFTGSGNINLEVANKSLEIIKIGSGALTITGKTSNLDIEATGSGTLNAKKLISQTTTVTQTGSGDTTVFAVDTIKAAQNGSGSIVFFGNPTIQNKTTNGSGSIVGK